MLAARFKVLFYKLNSSFLKILSAGKVLSDKLLSTDLVDNMLLKFELVGIYLNKILEVTLLHYLNDQKW